MADGPGGGRRGGGGGGSFPCCVQLCPGDKCVRSFFGMTPLFCLGWKVFWMGPAPLENTQKDGAGRALRGELKRDRVA